MAREMRDREDGRLPVALQNREHKMEHLHRLLCEEFNDKEILDVAIAVGVRPDELPGLVCRDKARALLDLLRARERLADLIEECREVRPFTLWPNVE